MLRPASKKHIRTISVSRVRVFTSRPSFPSLKLKRSHRMYYFVFVKCQSGSNVWATCPRWWCPYLLCWSFSPTCRVHWRKPRPASTRCLRWGFGRAHWPGCPLSAYTVRPAASHGSLGTAALHSVGPWKTQRNIQGSAADGCLGVLVHTVSSFYS